MVVNCICLSISGVDYVYSNENFTGSKTATAEGIENEEIESEDEKEEVDDEAKDEDSKKYDPEVSQRI